MEPNRCPSCARTWTAGEVMGLGILRPRPAVRGGPYLEFRCPGCDALLHLIPHGEGRYALPGEPPPPPARASERAPPWVRPDGTRARPRSGPATKGPRAAAEDPEAPEPIEIPVPPGERPESPPPDDGEEGERGRTLSVPEALDVLGIPPTAERDEIERAFRERSLTCHPDKVAHLDSDFQALAQRKFLELRRAYELLTS